MFDIYQNREEFTAVEAAALAVGALPTDSLKAAIVGAAPAETPDAVRAREVFDILKTGYQVASGHVWYLVHEEGTVPARSDIWSLPSVLISSALGHAAALPAERALELVQKTLTIQHDLEEIPGWFERTRFEREYIAAWLVWEGIESAYPFAPAETAQEQQATPPAPVQNALATQEIASVFAGIGFTQDRWPRALSSTKYLEPARVRPGARGGPPALWNPFKVAQAIFLKEHRSNQGELLEKLNRRFIKNKALHPWGDEWESFYSIHTDKD